MRIDLGPVGVGKGSPYSRTVAKSLVVRSPSGPGSARNRACGVLALFVVLTGCTSTRVGPPPVGTVTRTETLTRPPTASAAPMRLALVDVPPWPPGSPTPQGEKQASCPYLKAGLNIEPDPSGTDWADLEGNRVQRVAVLTALK